MIKVYAGTVAGLVSSVKQKIGIEEYSKMGISYSYKNYEKMVMKKCLHSREDLVLEVKEKSIAKWDKWNI